MDGEKIVRDADIVVTDNRIMGVGARGSVTIPEGAEVIDVSKLSGELVIFGATVKLVDEDTEEERVYQIVGDAESDVKEGRISISSPIARALIGKSVGDTVEVTAPGGSHSYEILEVAFS